MQGKTVTDRDLALFLASRRSQRADSPNKDIPDTPAAELLSLFTAEQLQAALQDKAGEPITLAWYVRQMVDLLEDKATRVPDRLRILEHLKDLLVLGAIQDPELAKRINRRGTGPKQPKGQPLSDPFAKQVPAELKLKRA